MAALGTYSVYVCILLERNGKVFLAQRINTGWMDGHWHIPGGGLEANESLMHATAREAKEELGITVDPADLKLIHVAHFNTSKLGFYFTTKKWQGEPKNTEPHLCSAIGWFDRDDLPQPISPYAVKVIHDLGSDKIYDFYDN